MAYKNFDDLSSGQGLENNQDGSSHVFDANGQSHIDLPDVSYVRDADMVRDGMDLVLDGPQGEITIEGYFAADPAPTLTADDGSSLTPGLVHSFVQAGDQYAQNVSMSDASPVGSVQEISGSGTVTHADGSSEPLQLGTEIYEGDVIETGADGAVNIGFSDGTSFAVSEDARMAIDNYSFDAGSESGVQDFSVLKGMFVFTSGLIGRADPDDVSIDTPVGSIGIRGTIIAGDVNSGEITVLEGAIVLRDFSGNEVTLASQFETATFRAGGAGIEYNGQRSAADMTQKFVSISKVSPTLFSAINDTAAEAADDAGDATLDDLQEDTGSEESGEQMPDADGSVDHDGDGEVDGSVEVEESANEEGGEEVDEGVAGEEPSAGEAETGAVDDMPQGDTQMADAPQTQNTATATTDSALLTTKTATLAGTSTHTNTDSVTKVVKSAVAAATTTTTSNSNASQTETQISGDSDANVPPPPPPSGNNPPAGPTVYRPAGDTDGTADTIVASQGGVVYEGNGDENYFTNYNAGQGIKHQDLWLRGMAGDDEFDMYTSGTELRFHEISGGAGDDEITLHLNAGQTLRAGKIHGGAGDEDELEIEGSGASIDFSNVNQIQEIRGIEKIDLTDGGAQTVTLTEEMVFWSNDVMSTSSSWTFTSGAMKTITINGDAGDTVYFDFSEFSNSPNLNPTNSGLAGGYDWYEGVYNGENVRLLIDSDINVQDIP